MNNISIIFGKRGSGKTTLAKKLLKIYSKNKNLFVWDYLAEYNEGIIFVEINTLLDFIQNNLDNNQKIKAVLRFPESDFDTLCKIIYTLNNSLFLIEETDSISSSSYISENFAKIIRYGRHNDINLIAITRRPPDIPRLLTSQATDIYVYKFNEPRDIDYLNKYCDIKDNEIKNLKQFEFIHKEL